MQPLTPSGNEQSDFDEKFRFIEALVKAWQSYGVSSRTMVDSLSRVVKGLGLRATMRRTLGATGSSRPYSNENSRRNGMSTAMTRDYTRSTARPRD